MIEANLKVFYEQIAEAKGKETWLELLNIDGKIINNDTDQIEIVNCYNNPFYFLSKLQIPVMGGTRIPFQFNIGNYLAIRNLVNGKNVVVELPPQEYKTLTALSYAIHQLIFTDGTIVLEANNEEGRKLDLLKLQDLIEGLPEYLKSINNLNLEERIIRDTEKDENTVLCIYDDMHIEESIESINVSFMIPTIICNTLGNKHWQEKLPNAIKEAKGNMPRQFVQVRYNIFDLGRDMEYAKMRFRSCNEDLETFLNENILA